MDNLCHDILNVKMSNFLWFFIVDMGPDALVTTKLLLKGQAVPQAAYIAERHDQLIIIRIALLGIIIYLCASLMASSSLGRTCSVRP